MHAVHQLGATWPAAMLLQSAVPSMMINSAHTTILELIFDLSFHKLQRCIDATTYFGKKI